MKRILLSISILAGLLFGGAGALAPAAVYADAAGEICQGIGSVDGSGRCAGGTRLTTVVRRIINILSIIIGIVAVIMIMVAGFKYITANGDSGNLSSAKTTLIYAIVGLVVVALAQFIVKFVLDKVLR
jgi:hypothetical protein